MNWLTNFIPPRIRSFVGEQREVPDNLWQKCPSCDGMLFHRDLAENLNVCYHCGHHLRITVAERLALLFDDGKYEKMPLPAVAQDPLKFKDRKRYVERVKEAQTKTGLKDAITVAKGTMGGLDVVIAAFNFSYMGGSMGAAVGEAIVMAAQEAVRSKAAFIVIPASGGARMQEGMISLMQMPRSIIAVEMVKDARLPYIVILTDPTTGGVSASFAMVGDIHIAEPGAMIGFAGRRVIEETVREQLPEDFQTAEYLLAHGMVDAVVPRKEAKKTLVRMIGILMQKPYDAGGNGSENGTRGAAKAKINDGQARRPDRSSAGTSGPARGEAQQQDTQMAVQERRRARKAQAQVRSARNSIEAMRTVRKKAAPGSRRKKIRER